MEEYDLIIIGAGPAGLTAGVYASRYLLKTLIIGKLPGGMMSEAHKICNFPTQNNITGFKLAQQLINHVKELKGEIKQEEVIEIKTRGNQEPQKSKIFVENKVFEIKTNNSTYKTKKIILAMGTKRRKLNVKGEDKFLGNGISYCATCDASFFKNKVVAVIGGSDAALTAALLLSEYAKKVYIVYRKNKFFRAEPAWIRQIKENKKIKLVFNSNIIEIYGDNTVKGVKLDTKKDLKVNGVFIEIGSSPDEILANKLGLKKENKYIIVNKKQETNIKGVFAAGDITNNPLKQVITACGEGAIAAASAYEEIRRGEENEPV